MGLRGRRLEVEGWGDGVIDTQSMRIGFPNENTRAVFTIFSPLDQVLQDPFGQSAKTMQDMFSQKSVFMWMAPESSSCLEVISSCGSIKIDLDIIFGPISQTSESVQKIHTELHVKIQTSYGHTNKSQSHCKFIQHDLFLVPGSKRPTVCDSFTK